MKGLTGRLLQEQLDQDEAGDSGPALLPGASCASPSTPGRCLGRMTQLPVPDRHGEPEFAFDRHRELVAFARLARQAS